MQTSLVLLALVAAASAAVVTPPELPSNWQRSAPAPARKLTTVTVVVQRQGLERLHDVVARVSAPGSKERQLTHTEVNRLTRPTQTALDAVKSWLSANKVEFKLSKTEDRFFIKTTYAQAAALFSTEFSVYSDAVTKRSLTRATAYTIPESLEQHVEAVFGLHGLPLFAEDRPKPKPASALGAKVTPSQIAQSYGITNVNVSRGTANRQAVAEFQGQLMSTKDLSDFFTRFVPNAKPGDDQVYKFVGYNATGEGVEALLDIQYIMGVAPGIKTEFWEYKNSDFCSDLQQWTSDLLAASDDPLVHSISYGWQGDLSGIGCTDSEVKAVDTDFAKLAAKGRSIIFASGDSGSAYKPHFLKPGDLWPSWPASSPWVTAVGATYYKDGQASNEEVASSQFGSGGGFSKSFDAPSYQAADTKSYLANAPDLPPAKDFPAGGRGTPDVAALGEMYQVVVSGVAQSVGGTSASAPAFSGIVSLLNEARLNKGMQPLGFLNNWLYANPSMFFDVTEGSNRVGRSGGPLKYGYSCTKGWDPVTGLGTPKFADMLAAALKA
eukprot:m.478114 g.478114  ORF g.478114 m.478114 type:complete len:551 (+) comp21038_c0_seq1:396-2048(+)